LLQVMLIRAIEADDRAQRQGFQRPLARGGACGHLSHALHAENLEHVPRREGRPAAPGGRVGAAQQAAPQDPGVTRVVQREPQIAEEVAQGQGDVALRSREQLAVATEVDSAEVIGALRLRAQATRREQTRPLAAGQRVYAGQSIPLTREVIPGRRTASRYSESVLAELYGAKRRRGRVVEH